MQCAEVPVCMQPIISDPLGSSEHKARCRERAVLKMPDCHQSSHQPLLRKFARSGEDCTSQDSSASLCSVGEDARPQEAD